MNQRDFVKIHVIMVTVILSMVAFLAFTLGSYFTAQRFYDCSRYSQEDFSREMAPLSCYEFKIDPDKIYQGVHVA